MFACRGCFLCLEFIRKFAFAFGFFTYHLIRMTKKQLFLLLLFLLPAISVGGTNDSFLLRKIHAVYRKSAKDLSAARKELILLCRTHNLPAHEVNLIEGDLFFNRGKYFDAIKYYKRALYDKVISQDVDWQKDLMVRLMPCYFAIGNIAGVERCSFRLERLARKSGDVYNQAEAIFFRGRCAYVRGSKTVAYRLMRSSIGRMEKASRSDEDLYLYYMFLVEYLQQDNRNEECRQVLRRVSELAGVDDGAESYRRARIPEQRLKDLYAHLAVLAHREGKSKQAQRYYETFKMLGDSGRYDYKCVLPYLRADSLYDDMTAFARERISYLKQISVVGTTEMIDAYRLLAEGYEGKGNYRETTACYKQIAKLTRNIISREELDADSELTSVYEQKNKEMEQQRQIEEERTFVMPVVVLSVVLLLGGSIIYLTCRFSRKMLQKNKLMVKMLDEKIRKERLARNEYLLNEAKSAPDKERRLFESVREEMISRRLYLRTDLNREALIQQFHIPKNKFSSLFTKYAGVSYSQFVNGLRLEYAADILKKHPYYTIDYIARECGMTATTFYRLFSSHYGMTPAEYREAARLKVHEQSETDEKPSISGESPASADTEDM